MEGSTIDTKLCTAWEHGGAACTTVRAFQASRVVKSMHDTCPAAAQAEEALLRARGMRGVSPSPGSAITWAASRSSRHNSSMATLLSCLPTDHRNPSGSREAALSSMKLCCSMHDKQVQQEPLLHSHTAILLAYRGRPNEA